PTKIAKVLGPEIAGQQQQTQQAKNAASQFGARSGGTAASMQMAGDVSRANINNQISSLLGGAAGSLGSMGGSLLGQGMQQRASQQQMQNWQNSIFGGAIGQAAGAASTFGTGTALHYL